jgi:hypothetical protein
MVHLLKVLGLQIDTDALDLHHDSWGNVVPLLQLDGEVYVLRFASSTHGALARKVLEDIVVHQRFEDALNASPCLGFVAVFLLGFLHHAASAPDGLAGFRVQDPSCHRHLPLHDGCLRSNESRFSRG